MKNAGFSLIEIMVAFSILAIGMLGVGSMLLTSMQQDRFTAAQLNANRMAMNILEEEYGNMPEGIRNGLQGNHANTYFYRMWVTPHEPTRWSDRVDLWIGWGGWRCNSTNPLKCKYVTRYVRYYARSGASDRGL